MIGTVTLNPSLDEWVELERLRVGELNRAGSFARYVGGKGLNVSRVVRELGGRTVAFTLAGGDDGEILLASLKRLRVAVQAVQVPGATRNNYKIIARNPPGFTEINTAGPPVPPSALRALEGRARRLGRRLKAVALSGSLPPGAGPGMYQRWLRLLRPLGIPVVLDSSGSALREGVKGKPWLIKPNRQEAEELLGRRIGGADDAVRAASALRRAGPERVVLSLGAEGAVLAGPEGVWLGHTPKVRVDSAVGAGDSLVGGLLFGVVRGKPLPEAFRLGLACGTATVMTPGTELCHRRDILKILPRVSVRRVG